MEHTGVNNFSNMKQIVLTTGEWLLVKIPEGATFDLVPDGTVKMWDTDKMNVLNIPGQWSIIGKPLELSEDECKTIVQVWAANMPETFRNYNWPKDRTNFFTSAKQSILSLIASLELKPETTLILKKII